jgi:menaquinone-9 beta-reductase
MAKRLRHACVAGHRRANSKRYARPLMPSRRTKRGAERHPLSGDYDVLICGASFAGLAVARELAGSNARVLLLDRYEIGERQTSACAAPTEWLRALGLEASMRQTFAELVIHTPHATARMRLPWTFSTFDYRELCGLMWDQCDAQFETAKVEGQAASSNGDGTIGIETDRGALHAPLVVDALGWRRILAADGVGFQPPDAPLSRGLEVHPHGASDELEIWIDRGYVPAGYGWSFPARDEVRVGVGSFDPRHHVKEPTVRLAEDLERDPVRYQGNWIPHKLRPAAEGGVFFVGDSAGHCLPLTAEGIRTAFYFGIACGRALRAVQAGTSTREEALRRYGAFSDRHEWKFRWMLRTQRTVPRVPPRLLAFALRRMEAERFVRWSFNHYLNIAPPTFARASDEVAVDTEVLAGSGRRPSPAKT